MTDNEIIKALKCCLLSNEQQVERCEDCPLYETYEMICQNLLAYHALDLINRQKAEIERLRDEVKEKTETITFLKDQSVGWSIDFCNLKAKLNTAKAEAIKEFAERLKESCLENPYLDYDVLKELTDNLVKEMTERKHDG